MREFKKFILRGNAVDMAVGLAVGAAFGAVVTALVTDVITPLTGVFGSLPNFADLSLKVGHATLRYGLFFNALISFFLLALVVFFAVVKPMNHVLSKLKPEDEVEKPAEKECKFCLSAIPAEAKVCKFCANKQ